MVWIITETVQIARMAKALDKFAHFVVEAEKNLHTIERALRKGERACKKTERESSRLQRDVAKGLAAAAALTASRQPRS